MQFREGEELVGESGDSYLVVSPLGSVKPGATPNVWSAVDAQTQEEVFILKGPGNNDTQYRSWPKFQSEMVMHELFKDCPHIRRQHDRIPPRRNSGQPPTLVLEPSECTLSGARSSRPLTDDEIKSIVKGTLLGLHEIHNNGLVYADLKPDNILVNGFRKVPNEGSKSEVVGMLGDLGIVMEPAMGTVQPLAYRSPEVHFSSVITPAADIWSWGMIVCHLLEGQVRPSQSGMYEFLYFSSALEAEDAIRRAIYYDFALDEVPFYKTSPLPRGSLRTEDKIWSQRLLEAGISENSVDFLAWVLNPDPFKRPSAKEILEHAWLSTEDAASKNESTDAVNESRNPSEGLGSQDESQKDAPDESADSSRQSDAPSSPSTSPPPTNTNKGLFNFRLLRMLRPG